MKATIDRRIVVFALLAVAILVSAFMPIHFPLDDAYITLHNARTLLAGSDPLYGVHPLVGATSPLHLLAVALFALLLPLPNAALVVATLSVAAYAAGLWRWGWKVMVIGLLAGTIPLHLFNGMETVMAMAAVTWAIIWMDDRKLPYLAGLLPFVRPELALLGALLLARDLWIRRDWRRPLVAALVALPFAAWLYFSIGSPVPNTVAAKAAWFNEDMSLFQRLFGLVESANAAYLSPLLACAVLLTSRRGGAVLLLFLALWLAMVAATYPGALFSNYGRYWAIAVPIVCYSLVPVAQWIMLAVTAITLGALYIPDRPGHAPWGPMVAAAAKLPPGSTVLIHDAGEIAYANPPLKLIDVVGLKSPRSAEIVRQSGSKVCNWDRALDQIARESGASYAIVLDVPFWGCVATNLRRAGWTLTPVHGQQGGFYIYAIAKP